MKHLRNCFISRISLEQLMSAEMLNERNRHEQKAKIAKIMPKSAAEITAEDMKLIEERIASRENPSSSSSRPNLEKGTKVEDDANKGTPKAALAVVRKISKAPPAQPPNRDIPPAPRRPTPPIDPPAKRAKGASKGVAERAASGSKGSYKGAAVRAESGSRSGKGKGKGNWGGKVKPKGGSPDWYRLPGHENFEHLPTPPPPFDGPAPDRRFDGEERLPIRRNVYEDVRETDRRRRERAAEPPNDAYREWHERAWAGQSLAPPADNRDYGINAGYHAEYRSRSSGWHPSLHPPTNMSGRHRTRSPARGHDRGPVRGPNRNPRISHHDGNMELEVVDDDWWGRQNQRHQDRVNEEYQLERAD